MIKLLLWLILFVLCWPLALVALILYPLVWILLLPFKIVGMILVSVKLSAPVMVSVTGTFAAALPRLVTIAWKDCGFTIPFGRAPSATTKSTDRSLFRFVVRRVSGRKLPGVMGSGAGAVVVD